MSTRIRETVQPVVEGLGYELWHLELEGGGNNRLLRLYIDVPQDSERAGITLDDCERVSNEVSAVLDVADPFAGAYRLEVSSPGLDRPLVEAAHFRRYAGQWVRIKLYAPIDGRRRLTGVLVGIRDDGTLDVMVDGNTLAVPRSSIARARLALDLD